jgi:hypothetical protein
MNFLHRRITKILLRVAGITTLFGAPVCFAQTTVTPTQIPNLLANPDMGWETFQTISSSGVTTPFSASTDQSLPSWLPSGVMYYRPSWAEMEPQQGVLSNVLDNALSMAHAAHQRVQLRPGITLRWPTGVNAMPQWVMNLGATEQTLQGFLVPNYSNSVIVSQYVAFVKLLGQKYDSSPDLGTIDISGIGAAENEWHMSPFYEDYGITMPPFSSVEQPIIDAFKAAFPHHAFIMNVDAGGASTTSGLNQALGYAGTADNAGWRGDCFGDTKFAMVTSYPNFVNGSSMVNAWKNGPVALESCYDIAQWPSQGYASYRAIFNYGLAAHASLINNKSISIGTNSTAISEVQRFLTRLGYRLVLNQLTIPASVAAGSPNTISQQWQNVGSAPCYSQTYRLAYRLTDSSGVAHVFLGTTNPCTFMPGDLGIGMPGSSYLSNPTDLPNGPVNSVNDTLTLPSSLLSGTYSLAIGIADTSTSAPVVQLAISGKDASGWYPMGSVSVVGGSAEVAPAITTASLPSATAGTAYSATIAATGGAPMTWGITSGSLPTGLTLNSSTGAIGGTPSTASTSSFTAQASNAAGSNAKPFSITVNTNANGSATWYELVSVNSGLCLSVPGSSTTENTQLRQSTCNAGSNQKFQLTAVSGGYKIIAQNSGMGLNVRGGATATQNGVAIIQWPWSGVSNEIWQSHPNSDGSYYFTANSSGMCMIVANSSKGQNYPVEQWTCGTYASQNWKLVATQ